MISKAWAGGSTRRWRAVRGAVLLRDGGRCRAHADGWCARVHRKTTHRCTGTAVTAHHTLGRARTGDDPDHLVAACKACNQYIGDPLSGQPRPGLVTRF